MSATGSLPLMSRTFIPVMAGHGTHAMGTMVGDDSMGNRLACSWCTMDA
jgi:hypothetical protein